MSGAVLPARRLCHADASPPVSHASERRVRWVAALTFVTMIVELIVGYSSGSLALVADGWHMASHAGALGVAAVAYWFARARAHHASFAFGTGKVNALVGYTNAALLAAVVVEMTTEAVRRLWHPEAIDFAGAVPVAVLGLVVNIVSVLLLQGTHEEHEEGHAHACEHEHNHDHNFRAAYMHVVADIITSVAALLALVGARYLGVAALDPIVALAGGVLIARWAASLCIASARQLLDIMPSPSHVGRIRDAVEALGGARVVDLHVWPLGGGRSGCVITIVCLSERPASEYRAAIQAAAPIEHLTVEIQYSSPVEARELESVA